MSWHPEIYTISTKPAWCEVANKVRGNNNSKKLKKKSSRDCLTVAHAGFGSLLVQRQKMNSKSIMEGRPATGESSVTPRHCWDSASCSWPLTTHCRVKLRRKKGTWVKPSQCPVSRESLSTALDAGKSSNGRCKLDYL